MPLYMYQAAYAPESWSAQPENPQNRIESVGRQVCEVVRGKLVGGGCSFGEYDLVIIADVPGNEAMAAIALGVAAGGAIKSARRRSSCRGPKAWRPSRRRTPVTKTYRPAR